VNDVAGVSKMIIIDVPSTVNVAPAIVSVPV